MVEEELGEGALIRERERAAAIAGRGRKKRGNGLGRLWRLCREMRSLKTAGVPTTMRFCVGGACTGKDVNAEWVKE